ncbi:MAG: FIST C-terminal domain-containing protein [Planctomycetota bacterium]|nr:FIST C-terminal domain-containing protein [Planctomycetota bacterium]
MKLASALSTLPELQPSLAEACASARQALGESPVDVALVFVSSTHLGEALDRLPGIVRELTGARHLLGCTAEGIIGGGREVEREPAVSVLLCHMPGVEIHPFTVHQKDLETIEEAEDLISRLGVGSMEDPTLLLLGDPYSIDVMRIISGCNEALPGCPIIGGMASGGMGPDQQRIFFQDETLHEGAAGLSLSGDLRVDTIVSQGCRPVGTHKVITRVKDNVIFEIGGKPAADVLSQTLAELADEERDRAKNGLHVGRVIREEQTSFGRGDFLIRNLMGIDPDSGAIAVGDHFHPGQTIQFHIRDAEAAREDLELLLGAYKEGERKPSAGGLLFSCNGRGERLFGVKDHDSGVIRDVVGEVPIAGFFCAGEIGPIGGRNFLHGFTNSIAFFS